MAAVTRFLMHKHPKHAVEDVPAVDGQGEHQEELKRISNSWKRIFSISQEQPKGRWVPSVSSVIQAGDEGLFSSTIFDRVRAHAGEISLESFYEAFAEELRSRPLNERVAYTGNVPKFLAVTKRPASPPRRTQSMSHRAAAKKNGQQSPRSQRKSMDFSIAEAGLSRSYSRMKPSPTLAPLVLPADKHGRSKQPLMMEDGQVVQQLQEGSAISITPAELLALSIVAGCPIQFDEANAGFRQSQSAFGLSIASSLLDDGRTQIKFHRNSQTKANAPAQGSGYSPLYAKHMATGALPFGQRSESVRSILVTKHTLEALRTGLSMDLHECRPRGPQSAYLSALPTSRKFSFHIASVSSQVHSTNPFIDAVASLPFVGGLTPFASTSLVESVRCVAAGGLPSGRLLQRLEGLVDKVNRHSPHLKIFGSLYEPHNAGLLYREQERLGRLSTSVGTADTLAEKVSRMHRYTTLLQRLIALVPQAKAEDTLEAVQQMTQRDVLCSYNAAVIAHQSRSSSASSIAGSFECSPPDTQGKRASRQSLQRSKRSSTASRFSVESPRSQNGIVETNLGRQMEQILKVELPLSVEQIAFVARMIIVAWTLSVEKIAWDDIEDGLRLPDLTLLPRNMVLC